MRGYGCFESSCQAPAHGFEFSKLTEDNEVARSKVVEHTAAGGFNAGGVYVT